MKSLTVRMQVFRGLFARLAPSVLLTVLFTVAPFHAALAQTAPTLGTAQSFAVLGGSTVTNTGPTVITGDLGVSPGSAITGFPPGTVVAGTTHANDAVAAQAQLATTTAYNSLAGQACNTTFNVPTDLGGMTLVPGVYCFSSSAGLTGTLTLDAGGNPNAVWVFKTVSTLITASNSSVLLINGGQPCNVFWQVGSSATINAAGGGTMVGTIIAKAGVTFSTVGNTTITTLNGRALGLNASVTLVNTVITVP